MFEILVKFEGEILSVSVDASWTVARLKREFTKCHGDAALDPSDIEVIFCGKKLCDGMKLQECELQETSTLFATRRRSLQPDCSGQDPRDSDSNITTHGTVGDGVYSSLQAHLVDLVLAPQTEPSIEQDAIKDDNQLAIAPGSCDAARMKPKLYVYCKTACQSVQPGKLRVCCSTCQGGMFIVNQDPSCWDDVLKPFKIFGRCQSDGCTGTIAKFYFKCGSHPTTDDDRTVALYLIKSNTRDVVCLTCGDIRDPVLVFPCAGGHTICLDCFVSYCQVRLDERRFLLADEEFGYTLPCPVGCPESLIKETHHFRVLGNVQYSRYQRFGAEDCLLQNGGVLCPSPGCGAGLLPDPGSRRVECLQQAGQGCGLVFCRECRNTYHHSDCDTSGTQSVIDRGGETYAVSSERAVEALWENNQSKEMIRQISKPCPKCKAPTEKNGGCMHMVCPIQQCAFDWCWVCNIEWNNHCMADHWFDVN